MTISRQAVATTSLILLEGLTAINAANVQQRDKNDKRPNLLVIMTDENTIRTISCYQNRLAKSQSNMWGEGNNVETPNIDRIAKEGALCMNFYSSAPVSTPARASFQTGLYSYKTGAHINDMPMDANLETFASVLKEEGYATSYIGKWHLGGTPPLGNRHYYEPGYAFGWQDRKFMFETDHQKWYTVGKKPYEIYITNKTPQNPDPNMYSTDFLTNKAIEIIDRDKNKPFCIMLSIPDPHSPDVCREPYISQYRKMNITMPSTATPEMLAKRPKWGVGGKAQADKFDADKVANYFAMVKCVDDNVGKVLKYLDDNNLSENTIVVFTADHGDMLYNHLRVDKGVPYDDAVRVPFVIRYPRKIKSGKVIEKVYNTNDFTPTILGLMGARQIKNIDGTNDAATFTDNQKTVKSDRLVYICDSPFSEWAAITNGRYKLVLSCREKPWLLDIEKDPLEVTNFYDVAAYQKIAKHLQSELISQMEKFNDPTILLKRPMLYSSSDSVTYKADYDGLSHKEIKKIEEETLNKYKLEWHKKYNRNY